MLGLKQNKRPGIADEAAGVIILVRFAGSIEHGGDKAQFMYELGTGLSLSIMVFTISVVVSKTLFASII